MRKPQEFGLSAARQGIAEVAQALQQEAQPPPEWQSPQGRQLGPAEKGEIAAQ